MINMSHCCLNVTLALAVSSQQLNMSCMKAPGLVGQTIALYCGSIRGYPPTYMPAEGYAWPKFIPLFITGGMLEEGDGWPKFISMIITNGAPEAGGW